MDDQKVKTSLYEKKDLIGSLLSKWRMGRVLPEIKGVLVDLSCGDNMLVRAYGRGTGVDVKNYGADVVLKDFRTLPFESSSVDTVTIVASLNYFDDVHATLKEVHRILEDDGILILTMSNEYVMKVWHLFREPWAKQSGFSLKEMKTFLELAGFVIKKRRFFMFGVNSVYVCTKK